MKIWIKMLLAIVLGFLLSFILPEIRQSSLITDFFKFFAELSINALLYLTVIYLFVKSFIGFIWFKSNEISPKVLKTFALYTLVAISASLIVSVAVMNISFFHPELNFNQKFDKIVDPANLGILLLNIINKNIFTTFEGPTKYLLPVLFVSMIFSIGAFYTGKKGYMFVDLVESIDAILNKITRQILEFFPIGAVFIMALLFKDDIFKFDNFVFLLKPFIGVIIIFGIIIAISTFLIMFFLKENFIKFYFAILGPALISLVTGNSASDLIPLNEHIKKNVGVKKEVSNFLTLLGSIFNKAGTAAVGIVVLFSILNLYSPDILTINFQLILIVVLLFFSLFLDGANDKGFLVLVSTILSFKPLHLEQDSYLLFIVAIPLFSRLGIFLDTFCNAMIVSLVAKKHGLLEKREYVDFI